RLQGVLPANALDASVACLEQFIGPVLNPAGDVGVGRAAVGRVVLEAAISGWIMGRSDDNAIGQPRGLASVVGQDGMGNHWGRGKAVILLDDGLDSVGRQYFQSGLLGWSRQGVGVLAHEERAANVFAP